MKISSLVFRGMVAAVCAASLLLATTTKPASKTAAQITAREKGASKSSKAAHGKRGRSAARRKPAGPTFQGHPTPDRYKEIQQALADKGYFKGAVDGQWGSDSVDALKRFQSDHQLSNDGKISSLSLIQLGLGPKHDGSPATAAPIAVPPPPPVTEAPPGDPVNER